MKIKKERERERERDLENDKKNLNEKDFVLQRKATFLWMADGQSAACVHWWKKDNIAQGIERVKILSIRSLTFPDIEYPIMTNSFSM